MSILCKICTARLTGRQRKFCSRKCKNSDTNNQHQSYVAQQARGLARKLELLLRFGNCCSRCGYDRNSAALTWHHLDPTLKLFELDMRSLSNRRDGAIQTEVAKCILLCSNCHAEAHFPQFDKPTVSVLA
jgi:hypothetical protein